MKKPVTKRKPKRATPARAKKHAVKRAKRAKRAKRVSQARRSASTSRASPTRQAAVGAPDLTVEADSVSKTTSGVISDTSGQGILPATTEGAMTTYELPTTFDATTVAQVHVGLRALTGNVRLDGTKVEQVDTAAAQLLAAFALRGPTVTLAASPTLADFLKVTAVGAVLCLEA